MQQFHKCFMIIAAIFLSAVWIGPQPASAEWPRRSSPAVEWLIKLGEELYRQGKHEDALKKFNKALLVHPNHPDARYYVELLTRPLEREQEPVAPPVLTRDVQWDTALAAARVASEREDALRAAVQEADAILKRSADQAAGRVAAVNAAIHGARDRLLQPATPVRKKAREAARDLAAAREQEPSFDQAQDGPLSEVEGEPPAAPMIRLPGLLVQPARPVQVSQRDEPSWDETERDVPPPVLRRPTHVPPGIRILLDGQAIPLDQPVRLEGGEPLFPLRGIAAALGHSVINLGGGNVQLIAPWGETISLTLTSDDPTLLMTEAEIQEHFRLRTRFERVEQALYVQHVSPPPASFRTYTVPKSDEQLRAEADVQRIVEQARQRAETEPTDIPTAARPEIEVTGHATYSYDDPDSGPPFRSLTTSVKGRVYGFDMAYESDRKDLSGVFQHDYTFLNLRRPNLFIGTFDQRTDLYPLRLQFEDFNGLQVRKIWGPPPATPRYGAVSRFRPLEAARDEGSATTLAWGRTEESVSGTDGLVTYLGDLYEARQEWTPVNGLRLKGALLYLDHDANYPENVGQSSFPRTNMVWFGDVGYDLSPSMLLSAQVARARYDPDNDPKQTEEGWNWRTAMDWADDRSRFRASFEYVGPDYASLGNPATYRDYQGLNLFGTHRLSDRWSVSSQFLRFRNDVKDDPVLTRVDNQTFAISTTFQPTDQQSINLRFSDAIADPEGGPSPGSSSRSRSYGMDYSRPMPLDTRLLSSYQYFETKAPAASDSVSHTLGVSFFKSFGRGSSAYLSQRMKKSSQEVGDDSLNLTTSASVNVHMTPKLSAFANTSYARDLSDAAENLDTMTTSAGLRYDIAADTTLGLEYEFGPINFDTGVDDWSVLGLLTKRFGYASAPTFGRIEGMVFADLNGNAWPDIGEPRMEDAAIGIKHSRRTALTDSHGSFSFTRVAPGPHTLELDLANLDPVWTVLEPHRPVTVRKFKTTEAHFPLIKGAFIRGWVFIDSNGDARFQETEEPLEEVAVLLKPGEEFRKTDADGAFAFDYLLPGTYTLQVYVEDLPGGYELASPETIEVVLQSGDEVEGVGFAVRLIGPIQQF